MRYLYEFQCPDGHISERLTDSETRTVLCKHSGCFFEADRIVSSPQIKLEGITGAFPGAYDRWERVRAEKLAVECKQASRNGEPT